MSVVVRTTTEGLPLVVYQQSTTTSVVATLGLIIAIVSIAIVWICWPLTTVEETPDQESVAALGDSPPRSRISTVELPSGAVICVRQITPRRNLPTHSDVA